jgi:hypothetical protein
MAGDDFLRRVAFSALTRESNPHSCGTSCRIPIALSLLSCSPCPCLSQLHFDPLQPSTVRGPQQDSKTSVTVRDWRVWGWASCSSECVPQRSGLECVTVETSGWRTRTLEQHSKRTPIRSGKGRSVGTRGIQCPKSPLHASLLLMYVMQRMEVIDSVREISLRKKICMKICALFL